MKEIRDATHSVIVIVCVEHDSEAGELVGEAEESAVQPGGLLSIPERHAVGSHQADTVDVDGKRGLPVLESVWLPIEEDEGGELEMERR